MGGGSDNRKLVAIGGIAGTFASRMEGLGSFCDDSGGDWLGDTICGGGTMGGVRRGCFSAGRSVGESGGYDSLRRLLLMLTIIVAMARVTPKAGRI